MNVGYYLEHARSSIITDEGILRLISESDDGWTVAHEAARCGTLPSNFKLWALVDDWGTTVAGVAAEHGHLSDDFNCWELAETYKHAGSPPDGYMITIALLFLVRLRDGRMSNEALEWFKKVNGSAVVSETGKACFNANFKTIFTEEYQKYSINSGLI
jgi:hypothetical protein